MLFQGSMLFKINVDTKNGGLQLDNDFLVDFGDEPDGPVLAHEVRYKNRVRDIFQKCYFSVVFFGDLCNLIYIYVHISV